MPQLQVRPHAPAPAGEESKEALYNLNGAWTFLRQHEWAPEVPITTQHIIAFPVPTPKNPKDSPSTREMRPFPLKRHQRNPNFPSCASKGCLMPFVSLKKLPDIQVSTREEYQVSATTQEEPHFPLLISRRLDSFRQHKGNQSCPSTLEMKSEISPQLKESLVVPTSSGDEAHSC